MTRKSSVYTFLILNCLCSFTLPQQNDYKPYVTVYQRNTSVSSALNNSEQLKRANAILRCKRYIETHGPVSETVYTLQGYYYYPKAACRYCGCTTYPCQRICPYPGASISIVTTSQRPSVYACACDPEGSKFLACNQQGQCFCKTHFVGLKCDRCKAGFWKNNNNCIKCDCDPDGSENDDCDYQTGQCKCKFGVGGSKCENCLPKYYGSAQIGCKECDTCEKEGHICNPENGKCVCPPLTKGINCEICVENSWGYEPGIGCKDCDCSKTGSVRYQCDRHSGKCICKAGFEGDKCDRCSYGFYGYPHCKKCNCDASGTIDGQCNSSGFCSCNSDGTCRCKENVSGRSCNQCTDGTFGLDKNNPEGCINCFCFGRSGTCASADYSWDQIRTDKIVSTQINCINTGTCVELPKKFGGDLTLSYGGHLRIVTPTLDSNFIVHLIGNNITLQGKLEDSIRITEDKWSVYRTTNKFHPTCNEKLTRQCLMVVLQKINQVLIEAQNSENITEILMDKAVKIQGGLKTTSIEECKCPGRYSGLSCQNPNRGYYRHMPSMDETSLWFEKIIGVSKLCQCNGRSSECDPDTGHCLNCLENTAGPHCEYCAEGHYKDHKKENKCLPCLCPSEEQNFARNCTYGRKLNQFICHCKDGYTGKKCNKCQDGYYGKPYEANGSCKKCNCHEYGSFSQVCDKSSGLCKCNYGFTGPQCNQCVRPRQFIEGNICKDCDQCSQILFDQIDDIANQFNVTQGIFDDGIQAPWKTLDDLDNQYTTYFKEFNTRDKRLKEFLNNTQSIIKDEDKVNNMYNKLENQEQSLEQYLDKSHKLDQNSTQLFKQVRKLQERLLKFLDNISKFGRSHTDIKDALNKGKRILKDIDAIAKSMDRYNDYKTLFERCNNILKRIEEIYGNKEINIDDTSKEVEQLKKHFEGLYNLFHEISYETKLAKTKHKDNLLKLKALKELSIILTVNYDDSIENVEQAEKNNNSTMALLNDTASTLERLKSEKNVLRDILKEFDDHLFDVTKKTDDIDELKQKVYQHIKMLNQTEQELKRKLHFTKDQLDKIHAGEAYTNIIQGVESAKNAAMDAQKLLELADEILNPNDTDPLLTQTYVSQGFSDRLKKRIKNFSNPQRRLDAISFKLDILRSDIFKNGKEDNNFNIILHSLKDQMSFKNLQQLKDAIKISSNTSNRMRDITKSINDPKFGVLLTQFEKYKNLTSKESINNLNNEIQSTWSDLQATNVDRKINDFKATIDGKVEELKKINNIKDQISSLKERINNAVHLLKGIDWPISLHKCRREYNIPNSGMFNKLSITFNCTNCNLFQMEVKDTMVKLSASDGLVKLYWRNGPNDQSKELPIDTKTIQTVHLERVKYNLNLYLGNKVATIRDVNLVELQTSDLFSIGDEITEQEGCIHRININNHNVGIWKYAKSFGTCTFCFKKKSENTNFIFNTAEGYTLYDSANNKPKKFYTQVAFLTFDDNALIFFAQEKEKQCAHIALSLKNGNLELYVRHNDNTEIKLVTDGTQKYNTGELITAGITLLWDQGVQRYILEVNGRKLNGTKQLSQANVFRIKKTNYFVGGVGPSYVPKCITLNTTSMLGFIKHSAGDNLPVVLSHETLDDVSLGNREPELNYLKAWFIGGGHLELNTLTNFNKKSFKLYFELYPKCPTCFLMSIPNLGKIYLEDFKLVLQFTDEEKITHNYNLAEAISTVEITISPDETVVSVNRENKNAEGRQLPKGPIALSLGEHNLHTSISFLGGISNIYINNRPISFNRTTISSFKRVEIGRFRSPEISMRSPIAHTYDNNSIKDMQNTQGCSISGSYETDPKAIKFGDTTPSFVFIRNSLWKTNYTIEFQFRTLHPNGLLFVALGSQLTPHFNLLEIKKGKLRFVARGKKQKPPIIFSTSVNDGNWHSVIIEHNGLKKKRRFKITLDEEAKKPVRMPKNNVKNEMYIGSLPDELSFLKEINMQQFRGCIKSFKINEAPVLLLNAKHNMVYKNVGSCFPKVEHGAYFGGDAFAIYKNNFQVNKQLELNFEFRTTEQSGILLSVSNPGNSPALSVELQNGAVVMTIDMGNNVISSVTNNLNSEFALCNNRWHNVTVLYSTYELTVNVDGIRKSWVQPEVNSLIDEIEAPLYIGGLPDSAPSGTLKIRENFKGCFRKLVIDNQIKDWTDMEDKKNLLLDSCPVASHS